MSVKRKRLPRESHRVRIVSDGTPATTHVYVGGFKVEDVVEVAYSMKAGEHGIALIVVNDPIADFTDWTELQHYGSPRCEHVMGIGAQCALYKGHPGPMHATFIDGFIHVEADPKLPHPVGGPL